MKEFFKKVKEFFSGLFAKWKNASTNRKQGIKFVSCVALILVAVIVGSLIQTKGWSYKVTDLRDATNTGTITRQAVDKDAPANYTVKGSVASGLLYAPKKPKKDVKYPAVVFTHGLFNNREMQEQNAIEAVRRGYVVLAIDCKAHGHNDNGTSSYGGFDGTNLLDAAKYLYNLPYVDPNKIAISGHSMGGGETSQACAQDGVDTVCLTGPYAAYGIGTPDGGATDANLKAGKHLGIISAAIVQANNLSDSNFGSNMLGVAGIKASSDEFFYSSTLKEDVYEEVAKDSVNKDNYTNYYKKVKGEFVKVEETDKYSWSKTYYKLTAAGSSAGPIYYLQSRQAVLFTKQAANNTEAAAMEKWETVNGGIYANGALVAQPEGRKLVSKLKKGEAIAKRDANGNVTTSIRAVYEARETHPMNHFSKVSAAHIIDFLYCTFGVSPAAKYIGARNQTWLTKEVFAIFGFIGIFGLLVCLLDMFLKTKTFKVLATEEDIYGTAPALKGVRKHISYWVPAVATTIFGAWSLANLTSGKNIYKLFGLNNLMSDSSVFVLSNISDIALWGIMCGIFALVTTALVWVINHIINVIKYKDEAPEHDENPFVGFRIRGWEHVLKTVILGALLVAIFWGLIFGIWNLTTVDLRFWTFDLRVFDVNRLTIYLAYAKYFFLYYLVTAALTRGFNAKNLPEWAATAINIVFNVIGITILMWAQNAHFINTGAMLQGGNSLWYIACYPIIPCVGFATWVSRKFQKRTGNAWLAGIVCALIMTFLACANTSIDGEIVRVAQWWLA